MSTLNKPLSGFFSSSVPQFECFQRQYGHLKISSRTHQGIEPIEIDKIIGTVGRCQKEEDFKKLTKTNRYTRIKEAIHNHEQMPAIEVYKVENEYYIVDGHHRVMASKELGRKFIDAKITEYKFGEPKDERYHGCLKSNSRSCDLQGELDRKTKLLRLIDSLNHKLPYRQIITAWYDTELFPWFNEEELKELMGRRDKYDNQK